jgi:hypothetical protein
MPENSENRTPITAQDLEHWFPHIQKMSDAELVFLVQGLGTIGLQARKGALTYVDDFISRWLLVFEAIIHDRGYVNFKAMDAALAAKMVEGAPVN